MSEPKSIETFLGNPIEETLVDTEELEEQIVKTKEKSKQRGHAVKYEFYKQFDNITEIQKEISNGEIHNGNFIFKFQDECKFRYYCTHQKNGCRAALYLELIDGSKRNCFISIDEHSNHKEFVKKYQELDEKDPLTQKIRELDNLNQNPESIT